MSFTDIQIKPEYRSFNDDIVRDFYVPLLHESVLYKRAVGFFSSTALIEISNGITGLVRNGGKMFLIASPHLSDKDLEAIRKGFELREEVIERAIVDSIIEPRNVFEEKRLNILANLIADGRLEIKIAFTESHDMVGMFHEKMGLMFDGQDNIVAFSGSMNETHMAFSYNYESIDVFCSWTRDRERTYAKERAFSAMWGDYETNIRVIDFPEVAKQRFQQFRTGSMDLTVDETQFGGRSPSSRLSEVSNVTYEPPQPRIPAGVCLHDYQVQAIERWKEQGFVGIFDMATGERVIIVMGAVNVMKPRVSGTLNKYILCIA